MGDGAPLHEALFENGVYPLIIMELKSERIIRVNNVFKEWFRTDEPSFRSISLRGGSKQLAVRLEQNPVVRDMELSIIHGNGKKVSCLGTAHKIRENRTERTLIVIHESLETSRQTAVLKRKSFNLYTLSQNIDMAFWSVDTQMSLVDYNNHFSRLLETADKPVKPPLPDIMDVDWKARYEAALRGEKKEYNDFYRGKNLITKLSPIYTDYGEVAGVSATIRDITEEINRRKNLEVLHQRFNSILDSATDAAIIATDPQGIIRQFNRGASVMLGYTPEEIIGKRDLLHFYAPSFLREIKNYIRAEKGVRLKSSQIFSWLTDNPDLINNMEWRFINKQRRTIDVKISLSTVLMEDQSYAGILLIAQDISELKRIREELEISKMQAEEMSRTKTSFLANMSHEIRTPLNGIIGMADLLKNTPLTDMQQNQVSIVLKSANTLLLLINDILDYTRIEAGKFKLGLASFSMRNLLEDISEMMAVSFKEKNIRFKVNIDEQVTDRLVGDPRRIKQILLNLVGNALKFTNKGFIEVQISQINEGMGDLTLYIRVIDTGIGISEEEKEKLFQSFSQADSSTTRKFGGSGLGLAISKELVSMMEGEIGMDSRPGEGSTFWFTIKLARDVRELENLKAIVINGNAVSRKALMRRLKSLHMEAAGASEFEDLTKKEIATADVILVHENLTSRDWRNSAGGKTMIIETSFSRDSPLNKNIDGRLLLPCRQDELINCLTTVIEKRKKTVLFNNSRKEILPEEREENSRIRILIAEDNKINQLVAMNFLKKLGYSADLAENGEQALEACRNRTYDAVLMDQMMPVMDGKEATSRIRNGEGGEANKNVKIIALTANAMKGDREALIEAGMDDYIAKPIVLKDIQEILDRNLKSS